MDALVMCGGRGSRLDAPVEKPLFAVGGRSMVERVVAALAASRIETAHAVVSPHAPATRDRLAGRCPLVETPGDGYVADLAVALDAPAVARPVLTVAADLPLLDADAVDRVLDAHDRARRKPDGGGGSLTVAVPAALKRRLGVAHPADLTIERDGRTLAPAGVNVVADTETDTMHVTHDIRFAVNVNRQSDAAVAEDLL